MHAALQPSPDAVLPSSHASPTSRSAFPHACGAGTAGPRYAQRPRRRTGRSEPLRASFEPHTPSTYRGRGRTTASTLPPADDDDGRLTGPT